MEGSTVVRIRKLWAAALVLLAVAPFGASSTTSSSTPGMGDAPSHEDCQLEGSVPQTSYEYFTVDTGQVGSAIQSGQPVLVRFYQSNYTLVLGSYSVLANGATVSVDTGGPPVVSPAYTVLGTGSAVGVSGSTAIVAVNGSYFRAFLRFGDKWYFDENIQGAPINGKIHRGWNLTIDPTIASVRVPLNPPPPCTGGGGGASVLLRPPQPPSRLPSSSTSVSEGGPAPTHNGPIQERLFLSGDAEAYNIFGWCQTYFGIPPERCETWWMQGEVALINFVYNGLQATGVNTPQVLFSVVQFDIHTPLGTGGMTNNQCGTLGFQFRDHVLAAHGAIHYHAGHLLSGKEFAGNCIGVGGIAVDTIPRFSDVQVVDAGGTYRGSTYGRMLLNSHEIGHTYTADHIYALHFQRCIWIFCNDYYTIMFIAYMGDSHMIARFSDSITDGLPATQANRDRIHNEAHVKTLR